MPNHDTILLKFFKSKLFSHYELRALTVFALAEIIVMYILKACLLYLGEGFILPRSPCPSIYHYEWMDHPPKKNDLPVKGVITVTSSVPVFMKVKLLIPAVLFTEYSGRLEVSEKTAVPDRAISSGSLEKVKYNLYYPRNTPVPQIILIQVNHKVLCSSNPIHRYIDTTVVWEHFLRSNATVYNKTRDRKSGISSEDFGVPNSFQNVPSDQSKHTSREDKHTDLTSENIKETCGKTIKALPLIVGGTPARRGDWPWMVPLFERNELGVQFVCGATLISDEFIVTAAHCLTGRESIVPDKKDLIAFTGKFNIKNWVEGNIQPREISEIHIHPEYDPRTLSSDLVLLKLMTKVNISRFVNPACIWDDEENLSSVIGTKGLIFGWGMDDSGRRLTDKPNLAIMPIASQEECLASNPELVFWTSNRTLCAGSKNGVGPCNGDSGSGVLLPRRDKDGINRWYLRGVLSLSLTEDSDRPMKCRSNEYIIFTDIAKYKTWISSILSKA